MSFNHACPDAPSPVIAVSAAVLGTAWVGAGAVLAQGTVVRSHQGAVSIGNRSVVLENSSVVGTPTSPVAIGQRTVFGHRLVVEDDVIIGPGAMIHGCHLEAGSVVEPAAIVCDYSRVGRQSLVRAGACVKQRDRFPARSVLDGFPAQVVGTLDAPPERPSWALSRPALHTLVRVR